MAIAAPLATPLVAGMVAVAAKATRRSNAAWLQPRVFRRAMIYARPATTTERCKMRDMDRQIREYIELGKANRRTIELVQNWCGHVSIETMGSGGLLEQQTGLPTGMRGLTCPYASQSGTFAMDLERIALEFHDRNCVGCAKRAPVKLPNFSEVVAKRDERRADAQRRAGQELDAERVAVAARAARRRESAREGDAARRSILERIDEVDDDPTPERAALLLENARAIPEGFDAVVQEALFALIDAEGPRARAALETLSLVAKGTPRLAQAALVMLARKEATALAADALGDGLGTASVDQIKAALPALFELASPPFGFSRVPDGTPGPLLSAWVAAPAAVQEFMGRLFGAEHKHPRILGCRCAEIVLAKDPSAAVQFARFALRSVGKPDDSYGPDGAASEAVATLMALALRVRLDEVDALLQAEWLGASDEQRAVIVQAYAGALKRRGNRTLPLIPAVDDRCFERIVGVVSSRQRGENFNQAIGFLRAWASDHVALVERHANTLLGAAALLLDDARDRYSPLLDPRPSELKALEARQRQMDLRSAVGVILDLLGSAGSAAPNGAGALIMATLENVPEGRNDLRAALVRSLGRVGQSRDGLALVVPHVYTALMAPEALVRAAAASAYGEIAQQWADDLPSLMHQSFLLLLTDSYVIVHTAAVAAVRRVQLPSRIAATARQLVRLLVDVYRAGDASAPFLADCVETFLRLPGKPLPATERSVMNTVIAGMSIDESGPLLARYARELEGVPEFGDAVVRALREEEMPTSADDALFRCVGRLPRADFERHQIALARLGTELHPGPGGKLEQILDATVKVGAWGVCEQIAAAPIAKLADVPRDRALRQIVNTRLNAVRIEAAIARGDLEKAIGLIPGWRTAHAEVVAEHPDLLDRWPLLRVFEVRVRALQLLLRHAKGGVSADELEGVASAFGTTTATLEDTDARRADAAYGKLLGTLARLIRWAHAVRAAEVDADRFLRAGKQAARDLSATLDAGSQDGWSIAIARVLVEIGKLTELEGIPALALSAAGVSLPLPFSDRLARPSPNEPGPARDEPETPCVVFVSFTVDGVPVADPHVITPNELHDLDVTVRVSRWPSGARLVLDALTVEPVPAIGQLPRFELDHPATEPPHKVQHGGRLHLNVSQPIAARPLEFVYRAFFTPEQPGLKVVVEGERRLRVRSHDPARNPVTGYVEVDLRLLAIRDQLRGFGGLRDKDVDNFLILLTALGQMAGAALQDKLFPGKISEAEFQSRVRDRLRANPRIGSQLQEHAMAAGGIMDLSLHELTLELKVDANKLVVPADVDGYSQQAAQYTTGVDKRLGTLCVLDCSDKKAAPGSVANDIFLRVIPPPGQPGGVPLLIGVVIVRGNLPLPSAHSK